MGKFSQLDRARIINAYKDGASPAAIHHATGFKYDAVLYWINRFEEWQVEGGQGDLFEDRPRSGRRPKLSGAQLRRVAQKTIGKRRRSTRLLARLARKEGFADVSHMAVWRALRRHGLKPFHRPRQMKLTYKHKDQRLAFCRLQKKRDWSLVVFSDEKKFELYANPNSKNDIVWAFSRDQVPGYDLLQGGPSVMVWAAISSRGKFPMHVVQGSMNAQKYHEILTKSMLPRARELYGVANWCFQQDGCTSHTARATQVFLASECPEFLDKKTWPARSPDLNPMDNLWAFMQEAVRARRPRSQAGFRKVVLQEWDKVPDMTIENLIASVPKRIRLCIVAEGGHYTLH
jgi:inhibitor of nuclear factor kappa-B kinase subunit alpha